MVLEWGGGRGSLRQNRPEVPFDCPRRTRARLCKGTGGVSLRIGRAGTFPAARMSTEPRQTDGRTDGTSLRVGWSQLRPVVSILAIVRHSHVPDQALLPLERHFLVKKTGCLPVALVCQMCDDGSGSHSWVIPINHNVYLKQLLQRSLPLCSGKIPSACIFPCKSALHA